MPAPHAYSHALLRVVPRVERAEFINVGAVVYCRALGYLDARAELDEARLRAFFPALDVETVRGHLDAFHRICRGDPAGGPIAALPAQERFHWLVAPRSTILQTSAAHPGLCEDPGAVLEHLLATMVRLPGT